MERLRRFLSNESATAEASSTVIMVAGVGLLASAGFLVYYGYMHNFFGNIGGKMSELSSNWKENGFIR